MTTNKEEIYDKEIAPLMNKIIEVCKREEIPFFCDFQLSEQVGETGALYCTTSCFNYDWAEKDKFRKYYAIATGSYDSFWKSYFADSAFQTKEETDDR